ncbi:hypothetical protein CBL_05272 [Carabus blaptoides fortunei]
MKHVTPILYGYQEMEGDVPYRGPGNDNMATMHAAVAKILETPKARSYDSERNEQFQCKMHRARAFENQKTKRADAFVHRAKLARGSGVRIWRHVNIRHTSRGLDDCNPPPTGTERSLKNEKEITPGLRMVEVLIQSVRDGK